MSRETYDVKQESGQVFPPSSGALQTEGDVETHFVGPLLLNPRPLGLELPAEWVRNKTNLRALNIGKGASKKSYFPDFLIIIDGIPVMAVEVKSPTENLDRASEEARLYATAINARFASGVNPCGLCLVSNGLETRLYPWDSDQPLHIFQLAEAHISETGFGDFYERCSKDQLAIRSKVALSQLLPSQSIRPTSRVGGPHAQSQQIRPNEFGQMLVTHYAHLFSPESQEDRKKIAIEAYVNSKRRERYIDEIERVVSQIAPIGAGQFNEIDNTGNPTEITRKFEDPASLANQVLLLVGSRGSGKSTFIDHLQHAVFHNKGENNLIWIRIDFNKAPSSRDELFSWTRRSVIERLRECIPELEVLKLDLLLQIFRREIKNELTYLKELYGDQSPEYKGQLAEKLGKWIQDESVFIKSLEWHFCRCRAKLLVITCDNCDKRDSEIQLRVFEVVQWLKTEVRALVVLPLRESTYEINKSEPPLDTALKSLVYQITPPSFQRVLMVRIGLLMKEAKINPPKSLSFVASNRAKIVFDGTRVVSFLKAINFSLFSDRRLGKNLMQGLSARNVRSGLEMFLDICRSGYLPESEVFYAEQSGDPRPFNESVTYNLFMRNDRRYYSGDLSWVKNLYQGGPRCRPESHFIRLRLCQWFRARLGDAGPSGIKGFHCESQAINDLVQLGHPRHEILSHLVYLGEKGLLIRESNDNQTDHNSLCCLSTSGYVHLELSNQYQYISRCAEDTYISDQAIGHFITSRLDKEETWGRMFENAVDFCAYLEQCKSDADLLSVSDCPDELTLFNFNQIGDLARNQLSDSRKKWGQR